MAAWLLLLLLLLLFCSRVFDIMQVGREFCDALLLWLVDVVINLSYFKIFDIFI